MLIDTMNTRQLTDQNQLKKNMVLTNIQHKHF